MRIFTAIRHSNNPQEFYGELWSSNFNPALQKLECEIIESQVDLLAASRFMQIAKKFTYQELCVRADLTERIIDEVREVHQKKKVDLFISYFYNAHFDPAGFDEIHKLGIKTVNFYCNSIHQFELVSEIAARVNFAWHTERDARPLYLQVGANPVWVQMGADPEVYYPLPTITRQAKACFIGRRYADREQLLARLLSQQIPVDIYGKGWRKEESTHSNVSPKISTEQDIDLGRKVPEPGSLASYARVTWQNFKTEGIVSGITRTAKQYLYRQQNLRLAPLLATAAFGYANSIPESFARYEVILNFSNVWADGRPGSKLIPHVRLRDFEAPLCRSCYLTGYSEEIAEFYELGKEIDTYQTPEELVDKVKFYLDHPKEAEKLREAGYERAKRDHTWVNRFRELFQKIGLDTLTPHKNYD